MDKKNLKHGFTIIEILVVAPIVILVIGTFISAIVSMTGEVLVSRGTALLSYNVQDALNRIEQDITTSDAYLATNNINIVSPQGYNNDTTYFHNADTTNGTMLILNTYAATENPLSSTRNTIYIPNTPNACSSPSINKNIPVVMNTVYFVKNNTLWRRTIATGSYATIGCSIPWQQPSCAPGVTNAFCKTQDIRLVDGIQSGGFSVRYYPSPISTTASPIASDSTQTDADRLVALQTNSTAVVTITATNTIAGRSVTQTGTIRAISPNIPSQTIVTNGLVLNLDAGDPASYPGSGAIWTDLSGNANNGILNGGVTYSPANSGIVDFDGTSGYVQANDNPNLNPTTGITVSAWIKWDTNTAQWEWLVAKNSNSGAGTGYMLVKHNDSDTIGFIIDGIYATIARSSFIVGNWYNIVGTAVAGGNAVLYVNGSIAVTTAGVPNPILQYANSLGINKSFYYPSPSNFSGQISNVQIYGRTLSIGEILQNFNALRERYGI